MGDSTHSSSGGIGFSGLLTIVFITLKLTHVIDWSWVWVLSPLWLGALLVLAVFAACFLIPLLVLGATAGIKALGEWITSLRTKP